MNRLVFLLILLLAVGCNRTTPPPDPKPGPDAALPDEPPGPLNALTPQEVADGTILLFDGATTFGWQVEGDALVENGVLKIGPTLPTKARPRMRFADCSGRVDVSWTGNSGPTLGIVFLDDSNKNGKFVTLRPGFSGHARVREKDGTEVESIVTRSPLNPSIPADSQLWLRNVKWSFNSFGKDEIARHSLKTWLPLPESKAQFADMAEGWKVLKGGLGGVRSQQEYPHYVLQLEGKLNGDKAHAEIVVRVPGKGFEDGLVLTLQAGEDGKLDLCSLKGKQQARKSQARIGEPFYLTVAVCENDLAAWVNGIQVLDWSAAPVGKDQTFSRTPVLLRLLDPSTEMSVRNMRYIKMIGDRIPPGQKQEIDD